jgi:hypothetical protein
MTQPAHPTPSKPIPITPSWGLNCITTACAATSHNAPGLKALGTMDKQPQRIPTWLSIDLTIIAVSVIIIAVGVWIGFEGPPFP